MRIPVAFLALIFGIPAAAREGESLRQFAAAAQDPSLRSIEEFTIQPEVQYQGSSQAGVRSITETVNIFEARKRGHFYGSVYEFHRNDNLDARNFFDPAGRSLPEFKRNQFGASFGIAVTRRLTLFGAFDGLRIHRGSTLLSHIPTDAMKRGDFSSFPIQLRDPFTGGPFEENRIPGSRIHAVARRMLATVPNPNLPDPSRNFVNNRPFVENADTLTGRADYERSHDSSVFVDWNWVNGNGIDVDPLPEFGSSSRSRLRSVSISYTRTIHQNLVASLALEFERAVDQELPAQAGHGGLLASLGISGVSALDELDEGYPQFEIAGYATVGPAEGRNLPRTSVRNDFEASLAVTSVHGNHKLQAGVEFDSDQVNNHRSGGLGRGRFEFSGRYSGDGFADFLLGIPDSAERGVGSNRLDARRRTWKLSLRDDWKIKPRLSLSLALEYNYHPFFRSTRDNISTFTPLIFEPPRDGLMVVTGSGEAAHRGLAGLRPGEVAFTGRGELDPAFGVAFSPLGNNRLVVRAAWQLSHDHIESADVLDYMGRNFPFYYTEHAESLPTYPEIEMSDPFRSATAARLAVNAIEPRIGVPYDQTWIASVQNEFLRGWNLEVGYEGEKSTRRERVLAANVPPPGPGALQARRPNPDYGRFSILTAGGSSSSHELELALQKRLANGFALESSYEWRRSFSDEYDDEPSNPRDLRAERAPEGSDHRLSLSYIAELPVGGERALSTQWAGRLAFLLEGWRISGITTFASGRRFSPRLPGDPNNDGVGNDRPDRIGPANLPASMRSIDRWFATEHFSAPAPYAFGNSGRNVLIAPGTRVTDLSFIRQMRMGAGRILELRVQLFNAFNHANFDTPERTWGTSVFGKIFGAGRAREVEIAVKYSF
jgi:hypothetical protein